MSANSKPKSSDEKIKKFLDLEEDQDRRTVEKVAIFRLLKEIWVEKNLLLWGNILILLANGAAVMEPRLLGYFVDHALQNHERQKILQITLAFAGLQVIRIVTMISHNYLFEFMGQRVMQKLRVELFSKIQTLPISTFSRVPVGKLVTRVTNDVAALSDMFAAGFVTIWGNVLFAAGTIAWLLALNFKLGLITISVLPFLIIASIFFSKKLKIAYTAARTRLSQLNAFLAENIMGMKVIFLFNRQKTHLNKFRDLNNSYANAQFGSVRVFALFQPSITLATGLAMALLIWYGGHLSAGGEITVGFLTAYFAYGLSLFQPVREIADQWNVFLSGFTSVERIYAILDWDSEADIRKLTDEVEAYSNLQGHIKFENVWFAYEGENWVLKDFNFEILPGQRIGIVGSTGSGKTTLINLLQRLFEPQRGKIWLDGRPLTDYDKRKLRASIGLIQQDVFLFSGSLSENLTLWRPLDNSVRTDLQKLTGYARLEARGLENTEGLQERGGNLSMGERQVVAFARAMHTHPKLWILDEATANVDSESEIKLEQILKRRAAKCTLITIAHRLASVRSADAILVMQNGKLVEHGRHKDLIKFNGLYARLYQFQELE